MAIENIAELVEPLKREVAGPGNFETVFPNADDDIMFAYLGDAFAEAQLDGYLGSYTLDLVTGEFSEDITLGEGALITIYAAIKVMNTQILSLAAGSKYKAGPVEYETGSSASVLKTALDNLYARRERLLKQGYTNDSWWGDAYWGRIFCGYSQTGWC